MLKLVKVLTTIATCFVFIEDLRSVETPHQPANDVHHRQFIEDLRSVETGCGGTLSIPSSVFIEDLRSVETPVFARQAATYSL